MHFSASLVKREIGAPLRVGGGAKSLGGGSGRTVPWVLICCPASLRQTTVYTLSINIPDTNNLCPNYIHLSSHFVSYQRERAKEQKIKKVEEQKSERANKRKSKRRKSKKAKNHKSEKEN